MQVRDFKLSVLFERAEDLPGFWNATILELDAVTTGPTLEQAFDLAVDMAVTLIADDLKSGREPTREPEPDAVERYRKVLWDGKPIEGSMAELAQHEGKLVAVAAVAMLSFARREAAKPAHRAEMRPVAEAAYAFA